MVYKFFDKKTESEGRMTKKVGVNVKCKHRNYLNKWLNSSKDENCIQGLKALVRIQI